LGLLVSIYFDTLCDFVPKRFANDWYEDCLFVEHICNRNDKAGTIDGKQNKTEYEYDDRKRLIKVINPDKTYRTIEYDLNDLVKITTDENQHKIEQKYDSRNRLVESIDANGKSTFYIKNESAPKCAIAIASGLPDRLPIGFGGAQHRLLTA
jgi:YD repeat-containing protein